MTHKERNMPVCIDCVHCIVKTVRNETAYEEHTTYKCADTRDIVTGEKGVEPCHDERTKEGIFKCGYHGQFFKQKNRELKAS